VAAAVNDRTLLTLSLTYRDGATGADRELSRVLESRGTNFAAASADMKFAAGVAAFGLALRESPLQPKVPLEEIANWAAAGAGADEERREFVELMRSAEDWLH
jgi:Ca-activated chloride channel family protein